jgi:hypothetical protein
MASKLSAEVKRAGETCRVGRDTPPAVACGARTRGQLVRYHAPSRTVNNDVLHRKLLSGRDFAGQRVAAANSPAGPAVAPAAGVFESLNWA